MSTIKEDFNKIGKLDDAAQQAGGYVQWPPKNPNIHYDWLAVREYRKKHNKTELTPAEWDMFILAEA